MNADDDRRSGGDEPSLPAENREGTSGAGTRSEDPLHRIRAEREAEELRGLREQGKALLHLLHQLLRNFQLYDQDNAIFDRPLQEFLQLLRGVYTQLGEVRLLLVEGQPYLGDLRLRTDASTATTTLFLQAWLEGLGVGGWSFAPPPGVEDLRGVLADLAVLRGSTEDSTEQMRLWVTSRDAGWVAPIAPQRFREAGEELLDEDDTEQVADLFRQGIDATEQYFGMLDRTGIGPTLMARKAVNVLVDLTLLDSERALSANLLRDRENSLYTHSLHVAVMSMTLGKELGLDRELLAELGLCGLFHDAGFSQLPSDDGDELDAGFLIDLHPLTGFRLQLGQRGFHPSRLLRALVNLEHHLAVGQRGEQDWDVARRPVHPFSRIVAVADAYVTLSTNTPTRPALSPPVALQEIWDHRGTILDPLVVQALVNFLGLYPYGTLLEINDGSLAVVVRGGRDAESFDRPTILAIRGATALRKGRMYDLARAARDRLHVVRICDAGEEGLDLSGVILGAPPS